MNTTQKTTAVLLVHGLQESPRFFDFLLRGLPEGTPFRAVQLPGHGGKRRSFRRADREAWERCVNQAAVELGQQYGRVVFVGHGMGCLLGLKAAMQPGIRFSALLFLACTLRLKNPARYVRALRLSRGQKDPAAAALREVCALSRPVTPLGCPGPYLEFLRLKKEIGAVRKKPLLRVTAAFCEKDEIVSPRSIPVAKAWRFAPMALPDCTHWYFTEEARAVLRQVLCALLES